MKYELDELVVKSRPDWSAEDFVVEKISCEEWYKYIEKYPNLSWGTHINNHDDDNNNKLFRIIRIIIIMIMIMIMIII